MGSNLLPQLLLNNEQPNHIILDFETNKTLNSNFYWASSILKTRTKAFVFRLCKFFS